MAGKEQDQAGIDQNKHLPYVQLDPKELFLGDKGIILTEKGMVVEGILQRYRVLSSGSLALTIKQQWEKEMIDGYKALGILPENLPLPELKRQFSNMIAEKVFRPSLPKKPKGFLTKVLELLEW